MNKARLLRSIAVLIGAAVLFGLEQGLGVALYIAIPAGILVYIGCRLGFAMLTPDTPAK
jgi:hypothetical protein